MAIIERNRVGIASRKIFEVLLAHPDGMNTYSLVRSLEASLPESLNWTEPISKRWLETIVRIGISAPAQAGWVLNSDGLWSVSAAGREAYASTGDADRFLDKAAKLSIRGWLSVRFPRLYLAASRVRYQVGVESGLIRRLGVKGVLKTAIGGRLAVRANWKDALPLQRERTINVDAGGIAPAKSLVEQMRALSLEPAELDGTDYLYLAPDSEWKRLFNGIDLICPQCTTLMVCKTPCFGESGDSRNDLALRANLLWRVGLGARVYEVFKLRIGGTTYRAYAVEHIEGAVPSSEDFACALSTIREQLPAGTLKPRSAKGQDGFAPASAVIRPNGWIAFRTFDQFKLGSYGKFLKATALAASEVSHWGDRSIIRGWKYLYQAVPGVSLPGRRDCGRRMDSIDSLMKRAGVSIKGRLVLDVGTNMGMMMAQYLNRGAAWCHGWDMESLSRHAEKLLLALGCTRFSVTGCDLSKSHEIESDLPDFLSPLVDGCVISYLAVRGPLGWLDSLARIPWSFMIYEGHEEETERDLERFVGELNGMVPVQISAVGQVQDGDSEPRTLAILNRKYR